MRIKGRALVVDDQEVWQELFEELLKELGLEVAVADNYEDAIKLLDSQYFHLAVLDVRLKDSDEKNRQGMEILSYIDKIDLGDVITKIVITGYGTREWTRESFKAYKVYDFIPKQGPDGKGFDEEDFIQNVESAFAEKVGINFGLEIEFVHGLTLEELASQVVLTGEDNEQAKMICWELDDLLRKLFSEANAILISGVSDGHSKTSVVRVEPFYEGQGQAGACIVKYGHVDEIQTEADNFEKYVKRFTAEQRHTSLVTKARTRLLGGIVYSLVGAPLERACSFNDFYAKSQIAEICLVLEDLFSENCRRWYENRQPKRTRNLADLYWQPAGTTLDKLTESFQHMYPRFVDQARISFTGIDDEVVNPLHSAFVKEKPIYLPVHTAITHGDLNGDNIFVDKDNHTWMIDFFRTGEGHILRDFVTLESVIKFQLLDEETLEALYEFEKALLTPVNFAEELALPQIQVSNEMNKAFEAVKCLRRLAGKVIQPSQDMRDYYAGMFYHTLNLIRYYHLLQLRRRKYYILLSAAMLCQKLENLAATRAGGI